MTHHTDLVSLPCRLYAVSSGNGNDGVSHMYPDYYCYTNDPYRLAELALVTLFQPTYQNQAREECYIDGEPDYGISAVLDEPLDVPRGYGDPGYDSEANGAYLIIDVFADDDGPDMSDPWHTPVYYSLRECFGA